MEHGPQTEAADLVHAEKYRGRSETFRECANRIAASLQDSHEHYMSFRRILLDMRFLPAGRIQAAMGSLKNITPYNCFVMPTIHDSFTDGPTPEERRELLMRDPNAHPPLSIMRVAEAAAITMRQGGGVGYDISTLRPSGDLIRGVQATTRGPMVFADIYNAVCNATQSAGNRRGAQMLVMRCDHPDIEEFIRAKHVDDDSIPEKYRPLRGFNMSVGVTDELIECVHSGQPFPLKFGGRVYREVDAESLWEMIMRSTYDYAEPGVIFIDSVNRQNNLWYCETIAATNPCAEQPLPPYGACLLGSVNLVKYLKTDERGEWFFDYNQLAEDIPHIHRAMDNVVDRARYPLERQRMEAQNKRRMGIGVTGLANCLERLGAMYGTDRFVSLERNILSFITRHLYIASAKMAKEKGPFHLYDKERYLKGEFIKGLDDEVRGLIAKNGIRNSHLTSIAPTGTISFCADNVSSGIEPVFAFKQKRRVKMENGDVKVACADYGDSFLGTPRDQVNTVGKLEVDHHVKVLCEAQRHVDSSVSKTCNMPSDYPYDKFKEVYMQVFENGGKGCTTYRPNGKYDDVLKSDDDQQQPKEAEIDEGASCGWDPVTGQRTGACADV